MSNHQTFAAGHEIGYQDNPAGYPPAEERAEVRELALENMQREHERRLYAMPADQLISELMEISISVLDEPDGIELAYQVNRAIQRLARAWTDMEAKQ